MRKGILFRRFRKEKINTTANKDVYKQWLVLDHLEIPVEFPMASTCLVLSVTNHAYAHTRNIVQYMKKEICPKLKIVFIIMINAFIVSCNQQQKSKNIIVPDDIIMN